VIILVLTLICCGIALICLTLWGLDSRAKRRSAEDKLLVARVRADYLHDQVPFPMGERLP
jgi:hypothetical protein